MQDGLVEVSDSRGRKFYQVKMTPSGLYVGKQKVVVDRITTQFYVSFNRLNNLNEEELRPREALDRLVRICLDKIDSPISKEMNGFLLLHLAVELQREPGIIINDYVSSSTLYRATLQLCRYFVREGRENQGGRSLRSEIIPHEQNPFGDSNLNGTDMSI